MSKDFEDEVAEGAYDTFQLEFVEGKKKVSKTFSQLELGGIVDIELE